MLPFSASPLLSVRGEKEANDDGGDALMSLIGSAGQALTATALPVLPEGLLGVGGRSSASSSSAKLPRPATAAATCFVHGEETGRCARTVAGGCLGPHAETAGSSTVETAAPADAEAVRRAREGAGPDPVARFRTPIFALPLAAVADDDGTVVATRADPGGSCAAAAGDAEPLATSGLTSAALSKPVLTAKDFLRRSMW